MTIVQIVYKVFGFSTLDSVLDPGYGIGSTSLFIECAKRCLSEVREPKRGGLRSGRK